MTAPVSALDTLLSAVRACRVCADAPQRKPLPHTPRPVLRASTTARLAVCGQAPGTRVHDSGTPFSDPSGVRLRSWMGVTEDEFYDEARVAIVPMGFCFPGQDAKGGDLPPRRECAALWHEKIFAALPQIELVLAVGAYAQAFHLGAAKGKTLQQIMERWR
ncbi:MAG: uracil-DNA glycosylase family protein, partial [Phycisphaerae bacterium]|nr:uracil-DNA glycosylase family protein [Phycisphaerae bacterium]